MTQGYRRERSSGFYRAIIESSLDIHSLTDADGIIRYQSPSIEVILGYGPTELVGQQAFDYVHPDDLADLAALFASTLRSPGATAKSQYRFRAKDGRYRILDGILRNLLDDPEVRGALVISRDVTEAYETTRALREAEHLLKTIVTHTPMVLWAVDTNGRFVLAEGKGLEVLGLGSGTDVLGQSLFEVLAIHPDIVASTRTALEGRVNRCSASIGAATFEAFARPHRAPDGQILGAIGVAVDVTERERLHEGLRRAKNLESVGLFAGGIAHDFNNLLSVILGLTTVLNRNLGPDSPHKKTVAQVLSAAERGADLTKQILAFARQEPSRPETLDLGRVLEEARPLLAGVLTDAVTFITDVSRDARPVRVDRGQLERVLLNMVTNARDAMPDGGELRIEIVNRSGDGSAQLPEPAYTVISITDTGHGMPSDVRERIFDPFFSTKPGTRGTGLGLATCYGIVSSHGGVIRVDSRPEQGTCFEVWIPSYAGPDAPRR